MDDWQRVGLAGPSTDAAEIKRAYARQLRVTRPDDDAAAYQALREAYDRLLRLARQVVVAEPPAPPGPAAEPVVPSSDTVSSSPTPFQLCERVVRTLRDQGGDATIALLPELMRDLEGLPLHARLEASVRFADLAIAVDELPGQVVAAWRDHFDWGTARDFRLERLFGPDRSDALARVLEGLVLPIDDPAVLDRFSDVLALGRAIRQEAWPWILFVATLIDRSLRPQWTWLGAWLAHPQLRPDSARDDNLLGRLGLSPIEYRRIGEALRDGRFARGGVLFLGILAAFGYHDVAYSHSLPMAVSALVLGGLGTFVSAYLLVRLVRLRERLETWVDRVRTFARPQGPKATPWWGVALMAVSGTGLWVASGLDDGMAWTLLAGAGVLAGGLLALPERVDDGLATIGLAVWLQLALGGMGGFTTVTLLALLFAGTHLRWRGHWHAWLDQLSPERLRARPAQGALVAIAATATALPIGMCWFTERLGPRVMFGCMLLALVLQQGEPGSARPDPVGLLWLPLCLIAATAAEWGARQAGRLLLRRALA